MIQYSPPDYKALGTSFTNSLLLLCHIFLLFFFLLYRIIKIKKGREHMPLPKSNSYTIEDIYALPDGQRAELIDGQIYDMAPPSPFHQELVMELSATLRDYIKKMADRAKVTLLLCLSAII